MCVCVRELYLFNYFNESRAASVHSVFDLSCCKFTQTHIYSVFVYLFLSWGDSTQFDFVISVYWCASVCVCVYVGEFAMRVV